MSALAPDPIDRIDAGEWPTESERRYADAQSRLADHHGVATESLLVESASAGRIHVLAAGNPDGDPVILLHGLGTTAATWLPLFPALADEFRLYAPDRPGRGLSAAPSYGGRDLRAFMTTYLRDVLDALEVARPHVVGNSLGGGQAFLLAIDHDRVDRLCLVGGPAGVSTDIPLPFRLMTIRGLNRVLYWLMGRGDSVENARERMARFNVVDDSAISEEFYEVQGYGTELPGRTRSLRSLQTAQSSFGRLHSTFDMRREIVRIDRPTSFVWGSEDSFFEPDVGRPVASRMADAEFHELDAHGHTPWLEPGDEVERLVREFLSG
ncbi:alpha/beta fold hydrolase [Halovivax sp.]|uniref:alpha/beta fold hydrolase n=1 Tax=Halovivax sp. TaxID=1935978 RepID=UPI0025BEFEB7|nr:alpha/beta fold hydrolase [Halovivax sp.]